MTSRAAKAGGAVIAGLTKLECAIAVAALLTTGGALLSDIVAREIFHNSLFGSLRVAVYGTAIAALFGFNICVSSNSHIRITVFDGLISKRWLPLISRIGDAISFAICAVFAYFAGDFVATTFRVGETDPSLNILVWPMQLALPWMFISSGFRYLLFAIFPELHPAEEEVVA